MTKRSPNWVAWNPQPGDPAEEPEPAGGPCDHCVMDNHALCVGVGCYGCHDPAHDRKHGSAMTRAGVGDV